MDELIGNVQATLSGGFILVSEEGHAELTKEDFDAIVDAILIASTTRPSYKDRHKADEVFRKLSSNFNVTR